MPLYARIARDPAVPMSAPDHHPGVVRGIIEGGSFFSSAGERIPLDQVRFLPPVCPSKIVCVGRNYAEHARELGNAVPAEPLIFLKPPSSLNAHRAPIVYPSLSSLLSYEGELGLVVGRRARRLPAAAAWDCVAGFTIINDVTARDLQKKDGQWTRGKGFDTFCPAGPWWIPKEEIAFEQLRVITRVNGAVRQEAPVTDMLFSVPAIVEFITGFMTLDVGDLIATGTPPGVGPMDAGDTVSVEIPGIGVLENPVAAESPDR